MGAFSLRHMAICLWMACLAFLTACGGGGGGDSDSLNLKSRVSTAVLQYEEDGYIGNYPVTIDISGKADSNFYIAVGYDGNGLSEDITIDDAGGNIVVIYIKGKDGLAPGEYVGNLSVAACADESCNKQLSSPLTIPYRVNISPIFKVNPSSINTSVPFPRIDVSQRISVQLPTGADSYTLESSEKWITIANQTASSFDLEFNVLPVGTYHATISVSSGGQIKNLPVNYTVTASELPSSQEPLSRLDGAYDWTDYQGGQRHNGYVPVALDASKFSKRWEWPSANTTSGLVPPVIHNNRIYLSYNYSNFSAILVAFNEDDGNMDLYVELTRDPINVTSPVVNSSGVYVKTTKATEDVFQAFNVDTGDNLFEKSYGNSMNLSGIPSYSIQDGGLYLASDYERDLVKMELEAGSEDWTTDNSQLYASSPVVIGDYVYLISSGELYKYDKVSGAKLSEKNIGFGSNGSSNVNVPVIVNNGILALSGKAIFNSENDKTLAYINADSLNVNWSVQGAYISEPVVGNGVLYILNRNPLQLEARNISDGSLLWTWAPDGEIENQFLGNLLLTDNILLLSTNALTHAIDLETHKTSWAYHKPSVSRGMSQNGLLYLVTAETVVNFNPLYMQLVVLNTR